ncbi:MAG: HEAT repeat domain-containing protein [Pseudomonadota bacterium]
MHRTLATAGRALAASTLLALAATTTTPALAEWRTTDLDDLMNASTNIAIADVVNVAPGVEPGSQIATLTLRSAFKGNPEPSFKLAGAERDPAMVHFESGRTVIAFFNDIPGEPGEVVAMDQGVATIVPAQANATNALLQLVQDKGANLRISDTLQYLQAGNPRVPRAMLAALLSQLDGSATLQDASAIRRLACRPQDFQPPAAFLGIRLTGLLAIQNARACLERHATTPSGAYAIEAVSALGNFADPRSLQPLLSLIPQGSPTPFPEGTDPQEQDGPGPDFDPEEEGVPTPDPREESDDLPPRPTPEDAIDNGRDEPDDDVSEDDDANDEQNPPGNVEEIDDAPYDTDDESPRHHDGGLTSAAVLALGQLADPTAVPRIAAIAREGDNLGLHSTVVHALALIASDRARRELGAIATGHPNPIVRTSAQQALQRLAN